MARTESRFSTSAWRPGSDWLKLPFRHKAVYKMVLAQGEVEYTGVVALTPAKWSLLFGLPLDELIEIIEELHDERYFVVDWDYEELLIRTFIRNDEVYRQPNLMRRAERTLDSVSSLAIRSEILTELQRIETDHAETTPAGSKGVIGSMIDTLKKDPPIPSPNPETRTEEPNGEPFGEGHREPMPEPFGEPNREGMTGKGGPDPKGVGGRGSTSPYRSVVTKARSEKSDQGPKDDPDFARWYKRYPRKVKPAAARTSWKAAVKKTDVDTLFDALEAYIAYWDRERTDIKFVPHPSSWLNAESWLDDIATRQASASSDGPVHDLWALPTCSVNWSCRSWTASRRPLTASWPAAPPTRTTPRPCRSGTGPSTR
jgi:hypothetical protein